LEALKDCKKLSAGVVFKSGRAWLGRDVLEVQLERNMKKKRKAKELVRKKAEERERKKEAYLKARSDIAEREESKWSVPQLKALVSYKKRKTDALPKSRADLLTKWIELKDRDTPPPSPVRDEVDSEEEEEEDPIIEPV
jgi:hypothetical protein